WDFVVIGQPLSWPEIILMVQGKQSFEPNAKALLKAALVDANDNSKERISQQEMDSLEDVYHLLGLTPIEVVYEEYDAVDGRAKFLQPHPFFRRFFFDFFLQGLRIGEN